MPESSSRLEQFKKMAEADPTNELGHFSLGRAYLDAGMDAQAIDSFSRVLELNPKISKVYQLMGGALLKLNRRDEAIARLTEGVEVAQSRGEVMPMNEMIKQLKDLGAPVPEKVASTPQPVAGEGEVLCRRCGRIAPKLASPPFRNDFGRQIQENTCSSCWREAIGVGTKVINELRLPLSDPQAGKVWDHHIREFLNLPPA
jgi:tetratricopeptide (TPR) repeat protein